MVMKLDSLTVQRLITTVQDVVVVVWLDYSVKIVRQYPVVQYFMMCVCVCVCVCVGCEDGDVSLVGGDNTTYGTVLVCIDKIWGLISDGEWDINDATVVCKQLGHISESEYSWYNKWGNIIVAYLSNVFHRN